MSGNAIVNREINPQVYSSLIAEVSPMVITSEEQYNRLMAEFDKFFHKEEMTPEEEMLFDLLVVLIEKYESEQYYNLVATPVDVLRTLMDEHGTTTKDLTNLLGSKGRVSEILNGKRAITRNQAKELGKYFHVSPTLFIDWDEDDSHTSPL